MSRVMAAGGVGKERQKRSTSAAVMRATSSREGAFSRRLMVGCEHRARPLSGARPTASLKRGSVRRAVAVVGIFVATRDREHAEAQHRRECMHHQRRVPPLPDAARQRPRPGRAGVRPRATGPARRRTRSARPRNRRSPSCVERLEDRTGEGYLRSWRAWRFRCLGRNAFRTDFLPNLNDLRHVRHCNIGPRRIKRVSDAARFRESIRSLRQLDVPSV